MVFLFRHCVRSIDTASQAPYSAKPFPPFPKGKNICVPRGLQIMTGVGAHLRAQLVVEKVAVVADDVPRNVDSAKALAAGLGSGAG